MALINHSNAPLEQQERIAYIEGRTAEAALLGELQDALADADDPSRVWGNVTDVCPHCGEPLSE